MTDIEFSALLCSRLCHDLISPVGAIANGLEILGDEDDDMMRREVMNLLTQSAETTSAKLKFFRLSFGAAGGFGEMVPISDAEEAIRGFFGTSTITLNWQSNIGAMDKSALKLMLNMVLVAGESLIRGGKLSIAITEQAPTTTITVAVEGDKVIFQDATRLALTGAATKEDIVPKTAPAFLAAQTAAQLGSHITVNTRDTQDFSLNITYQAT